MGDKLTVQPGNEEYAALTFTTALANAAAASIHR